MKELAENPDHLAITSHLNGNSKNYGTDNQLASTTLMKIILTMMQVVCKYEGSICKGCLLRTL